MQCASLLHPSCARRVLVVCSSCLVSNVPVSAATRVGGPDVTAQLAAVTPHALLRGHGVGVCLVLRCLAEQALRQRGWAWGSGPDHSADAEEAPPEEDLTQSVLAMDAYVCAVGVCVARAHAGGDPLGGCAACCCAVQLRRMTVVSTRTRRCMLTAWARQRTAKPAAKAIVQRRPFTRRYATVHWVLGGAQPLAQH